MNLLQMSIAGALLIAAVVLVRLAALRAVPKRTFLMLWALVLARLLVPFPPLLPLPSLLPTGFLPESAATETAAPRTEAVQAAVPISTAGREDLPTAHAASPGAAAAEMPAVTRRPDATAAPEPPQGTVSAAPALPVTEGTARMARLERAALLAWLAGMAAMAVVFAILYILSYRRFRRARPLETAEAEAWLAAHPAKRPLRLRTLPALASPLTYGFLRPVILLPAGLDPGSEEGRFALEHEYVHARRLDAWWKLLLAVTLAVHWFNPFVWLMWFLANRDLELSCDEEVLRLFGTEQRGEYARALVAMEEKRGALPPLHAGFGSGATKERILSIMKYKKATVLSVLLAVALVLVLAACALGGAEKAKETPEPTPIPSAAPTPAPAPAPTAAPDEYAQFESGGYTLSIPAEYAQALRVETEKVSESWELLFTVTEKASFEAGQQLSPGNDDGLGWLFSIARIGEDELGKLMMWDMSGMVGFAREETGDYLLLIRPTDVRFVPNGEDDEGRTARWEAMQDWVWASMTERFLADNESLTPCRHGDSFVENALARILYYDPVEYGEGSRPLIRFGDGEGVEALGTSQAQEDARKLLWGFRFEEAATAADFPKKGTTVTVTDPLGIELTFREDSDVVAVANVSTDVCYLRMVPDTAEMKGRNIGSWACGWYFDAAATLSGYTVTYKNGDYTLRLPGEYAPQLVVETPPEGDVLFRISEKASRQRWESRSDQPSGETDGWLFSILRMDRDRAARAAGESGIFLFGEDGNGNCYLFSYPIWQTFQPEEGATTDWESEAYRQFRTLYTAVCHHYDAEGYFIEDNGLTARHFSNVQQYFLCFVLYGYDSTDTYAIRQGPEGEGYDPRRSTEALYYLKKLLWEVEYDALDTAQEPAGEPIVLELNSTWMNSRLLFWQDGDLAALETGDGRQYYACRAEGAEYGNRAYSWAAACLQEAQIAAALPALSGRTVLLENRGVNLPVPEEYLDYLIVETPEEGDILFKVTERASWENGQKEHPGEERGEGWLLSVLAADEERLLWELWVHPTPTEVSVRDEAGTYYLLLTPSDVRYYPEGGVNSSEDESWLRWLGFDRWAREEYRAIREANPRLTPVEKAFCELEHIMAVILEDGAVDYFHFVSPEGAVTEASDVAEKFDYARRILLEGNSCYLPEDTPEPTGRPIRLETPGTDGGTRVLFTFWPGSEIFKEEEFYETTGGHSRRMLRMTLPEDGPVIGYLMQRWYGKAAEDVTHHLTGEIVGYGNDTVCIRVTEPGDSRLEVGFHLYTGGSLSSEEENARVRLTDLPEGTLLEIVYSGEIIGDEFGYCGPSGGPSGSVRRVDP